MAFEEWPFTDAWSLHGNKEVVCRYEILERIGEGTFGEVYRARRREDGLIVALKEVHNSDSCSREVKALLLLDHPNVVKLHEYFVQGKNCVLVLEYLPYNLLQVIRAGKGELSEEEVKGWTVQILQGLAVCHAASILHRDLKPNNLLIAGDGTLKIADFGQARIVLNDDCDDDENLVAGCGSQILLGIPSVDGSKELEIQADFPAASGEPGDDVSMHPGESITEIRVAEPLANYFGLENFHSAEKGNMVASIAQPNLPEKTSSVECLLRVSEKAESNGGQLPAGSSTTAGRSTLRDAVDDVTNSLTTEEMVRSGTGIDGLRRSGLHIKQIIGSQQPQEPGCCGWFALENAEKQPHMEEQRHMCPETENPGNTETLSVKREDSGYTETLSAEREDSGEGEDNLSSEESNVDLKGQYGIRSENFIGNEEKTEGGLTHGLPPGFTQGESDFLLKLRRFIRKRTRRLNAQGKVVDPFPLMNERISRRGGEIRQETLYDGHTGQIVRSPLTENRPSAHETRSVSAHSPPLVFSKLRSMSTSSDRDMVSTQGQQVSLRPNLEQIIWQTNHFHNNEQKSIPAPPTNDLAQGALITGGLSFERKDGLPAVAGRIDEHPLPQSLREGRTQQIRNGTMKSEKYDEAMGVEDASGINSESDMILHNDVHESKLDRKTIGVASNGPLREMAYTNDLEPFGMPDCNGQAGLDYELPVEKRLFTQVEKNICGHSGSMGLEQCKGGYVDATRQDRETGNGLAWDNATGVELSAAQDREAVAATQYASLTTGRTGRKDVIPGEFGQDRWEGKFRELVPERDGWVQMEGHNNASPDAEGTKWFATPEFQYSYMEPWKGDPATGKRSGGTCGVAAGWDEEYERGSEGAFRDRGTLSHESSAMGDSASEGGSDFTTMVGTRWYKAPELLYGARKYGRGLDIWAVGCIFGELLWGKPLFPGTNDIDQLSRLVKILGSPSEGNWAGVSQLPDFNKICFVDDQSPLTLKNYLSNVSDGALHFLQKLLTYDPVLRPSSEEALQDEFFCKDPLPCPCQELTLPTEGANEASDEEWGDWKDPGSPFSDFEILN